MNSAKCAVIVNIKQNVTCSCAHLISNTHDSKYEERRAAQFAKPHPTCCLCIVGVVCSNKVRHWPSLFLSVTHGVCPLPLHLQFNHGNHQCRRALFSLCWSCVAVGCVGKKQLLIVNNDVAGCFLVGLDVSRCVSY